MMGEHTRKFVVLDFDRTLVDLGVNWSRVRQRVADLIKTLDALDKNRSLFDMMDENPVMAEKIFSIIKEEELLALETAQPMPGAKEFLERLVERKTPFAIVSNNHHAVIEKAFEKFNLPKPVMVMGSDDVDRKKPHPEGMEKIITFLKASAKDGVLIGDSEVEVELGKAVGMETIIVSPSLTFETIQELIQ